MMTLDAPAPWLVSAGLAENRHEIELGVACRARSGLFEFGENRFQTHDRNGFPVSAMTQSRSEERVREEPLFLGHFLDRQSLSRARNEMPVGPFGVLELENTLRLRVCAQRVEVI